MTFDATCKLMKKNGTQWLTEEKHITDIASLRDIFGENGNNLEQIYLDEEHKHILYYSLGFLNGGIDGRTIDDHNMEVMLVAPILFVQADTEKPINITDTDFEWMKSRCDLYG